MLMTVLAPFHRAFLLHQGLVCLASDIAYIQSMRSIYGYERWRDSSALNVSSRQTVRSNFDMRLSFLLIDMI